jgi:CYTH domain-containing protein
MPTMKPGKYARPEFERRFLLAAVPRGSVLRSVEIVDRYLEGTRLRLRKICGAGNTERKLTQKIAAGDGTPGLITTIYLEEREYQILATLPGRALEKTRLSIPPFGIDVFAPPRAGLVLAEVEFETEAELRAFSVPGWAVAEVTDDLRFSGGRLAETEDIADLLRAFGLSSVRK